MHGFGINGCGRIGRTAFRVWWYYHQDTLTLKLINTSGSMPIGDWAHLLTYDSNYGVFPQPIQVEEHQTPDQITDADPVLGTLTIGTQKITITAQRKPQLIPWAKYGVETVIEATGAFTSKNKAQAHLSGGAKKVILSAPPKGEGIPISVLGISTPRSDADVLSNASCTTNCIAPIASILSSTIGVEKAALTTIHAYTDDQNVHDNSHRDLRRARAAAQNIVPTTTGAAVAASVVVPALSGKFDGLSVRVPVAVGSLSDMVFVVSRPTTVEEINTILTSAAQSPAWKGIVAVTQAPLVSSDIIGRSESAIVDTALTQVIGDTLVKVIAWYDNEWGYANRLIEQVILSYR